ncbi:MAG: hypothetical protein ABI912_03020 [Actinomycetota bacterium]
MGHVDVPTDGLTELRVHGVSGTAPQSMLGHPLPEQVSGDVLAGFFRRPQWCLPTDTWDCEVEGRPSRVEAYSWGGLTSGGKSRVLWILLLPFALLNAASFMLPPRPDNESEHSALRAWGPRLVRLLAVTATVALVLAIAAVSMDLGAWQCAASRVCTDNGVSARMVAIAGPLPGRRLAVASAIPLLVVAGLWYLARRSWSRYESRPTPRSAAKPRRDGRTTPLEAPDFWYGKHPVGRLRSLHITASLATVSGLLAYAVAHDDTRWRGLGLTLTALAGVLGIAAAVLTVVPALAERKPLAPLDMGDLSAAANRTRGGFSARAVATAPWATIALVVVTLIYAWLRRAMPTGHRQLPGLQWLLAWLSSAQLVLLVALFVVTVREARRYADRASLALRGLAAPVLAGAGVVLAGNLGAGIYQKLADRVGTPVDVSVARTGADTIWVPTVYTWTGVAVTMLAVVFAATVIGLVLWLMGESRRAAGAAATDYGITSEVLTGGHPAAGDEQLLSARGVVGRVRAIARARGMAKAIDKVGVMMAVLIGAAVLVRGLGAIWYVVSGTDRWTPGPTWAFWAGNAAGAFVLALLTLGYYAYKNPTLRRSVGIIWDLTTFWPRTGHPLAPPCYAERTVPDIVDRIDTLTNDDAGAVVLSSHSQGTVIAAATMLALDDDSRSKVFLLTYGCPLDRLYARFFPQYFGRPVLDRLRQLVRRDMTTGSVYWHNLYRQTDYVGAHVFEPSRAGCGQGALAVVDEEFCDPVIFGRLRGEPSFEPIFRHSDYWDDPHFAEVVRAAESVLAKSLPPLVPTAQQGSVAVPKDAG